MILLPLWLVSLWVAGGHMVTQVTSSRRIPPASGTMYEHEETVTYNSPCQHERPLLVGVPGPGEQRVVRVVQVVSSDVYV